MLGHPAVGWGEELEMSPHTGAQSRPGWPPQELISPHCRDPFPTSFTGPLSSQLPSDAGNQVKEGKRG